MQRMNELLIKDKFTNLDRVAEVLKEEITPIVQNLFVISMQPVVRFKREGEKYIFDIEIEVDRVKNFGNRL